MHIPGAKLTKQKDILQSVQDIINRMHIDHIGISIQHIFSFLGGERTKQIKLTEILDE